MFKRACAVSARVYFVDVAARRWRGSGLVLIVADDPLAREIYAELFALRGWAVATAKSARDGVLRLARDRAIRVVVIAVGAGALQLRRRLRMIRPSLRVHVPGAMPLFVESPRQRQALH